MITQIYLQNFKCFRQVEIHPKRVTCFVGANGTGKSSVLQAFGLLKQSVEKSTAVPTREIVAVAEKELDVQGPLVKLPGIEAMYSNYREGKMLFGFTGNYGESPSAINRFSFATRLDEDELVIVDFTNEKRAAQELRQIKIVPAVRGLTLPVYKLGNEIVKDIAMESGLAKQEAQTATNLGYSTSPIDKISTLLKRVTGVGLRTHIVPPQSVEVRSLTPSGPVNIVSEGFGTNSLIMLLLQLVSAEKGATVMIEEPEIHLHPKAQAELAEVLTEVALEEDKQVIMTTHSEHITGRLLTLVAEGKLAPDDVAIYAFEKDTKGVCTAKDLRINTDGTIEGGINDFFETNLAEMNRFAQAQFGRLKTSE